MQNRAAGRQGCGFRSVSVVGLGKLGLSMAVAFAKRGFGVVGVDCNNATVAAVNEGRSPIRETGVQELLTRFRRRIRATTDAGEAVAGTDATFIIVATPSEKGGFFSNAQLLPAVRNVGRALRGKRSFHVVSVTCTVMPGTTMGIVRRTLERVSGRRCGRDFGLIYNPEFIALGSVVRDFLNPDFVLVGESDGRTGAMVERFYARLCENKAPVARMKPVEAELAKISLNCYCTTKIAFANMLAEMAERMPGTDAGVITCAIGLDRRIGQRYLAPGLGFGGPCFPRDNVAFRAFARRLGVEVPIPEAVHGSNRRQPDRVVERVRTTLPKGGRVAVLGLAYKPHTPVVEESQALAIAAKLAARRGFDVTVYDPMAMDSARKVLGDGVRYAGTAAECLRGADLCIVATPWPEFARLTARGMRRLMRVVRVLDCWHSVPPAVAKGVDLYAALGSGGNGKG